MIHRLSPELINKIAAGEVVERPNSVVKELVENSIDAGAKSVIVIIKENLIQVIDDGNGIEKDDLEKLFVNHSTSKISDIQDLFDIRTMGFRGEALATIASVSNTSIASKHKNSEIGYIVRPDEKARECASNHGTIVTVENLFFNVPARKKFLKTETTENRYILDTLTRIAISQPQIAFRLEINEKTLLNLPLQNLEQRLKELMPNVKLVKIMDDDIVSGYIADPKNTFSKPTYQYMYVNGRYITASPALSRAVYMGYKNTIMKGQYPPYVIFINVPPQNVDVNVHPRKTEVKFENEGYIFQKIYSIIQHSIFHSSLAQQESSFNRLEKFPNKENISANTNTKDFYIFEKENTYQPQSSFYVNRAMEFSQQILQTDVKEHDENDILDKVHIFTAHQLINAYIVAEADDAIVVFDQHASAERYLFEKYTKIYSNEEVKTKRLLLAEQVPEKFAASVKEHAAVLSSFGIEIGEENGSVVITDIPEIATLRIVDQLYAELSSIFDNELTSVIELRDKMITTLSCHSAIRFGDSLSDIECQKIITDLVSCLNNRTCPHGRPTYYVMSRDNLKQIFKR